jgi:hypothetical protein
MQTTNTQLIDELLLIIETTTASAKQFKELDTCPAQPQEKAPIHGAYSSALNTLICMVISICPKFRSRFLKQKKFQPLQPLRADCSEITLPTS